MRPSDDTDAWEPFEADVFETDEQSIAAALEQVSPLLWHCLETHLAFDPSIDGAVLFEFVIPEGPAGSAVQVQTVDLASELERPFLEACFVTVFQELKFAAPTEAIRVPYELGIQTLGYVE